MEFYRSVHTARPTQMQLGYIPILSVPVSVSVWVSGSLSAASEKEFLVAPACLKQSDLFSHYSVCMLRLLVCLWTVFQLLPPGGS